MTDLRFQPGSIEQLRIDELRPYERNPRTHSDNQVAKLAASLVEFGWTMPILVNDELEVIAGHGRMLAARLLGLDAVPVIRLAHLTPEQVRAYRIADNKLALDAGWDDELLAAEFHELNGAGYDLGLTGFTAAELDELLAPIGDGSDLVGDPDKVPEPPARTVSTRIGSLKSEPVTTCPSRIGCSSLIGVRSLMTQCPGVSGCGPVQFGLSERGWPLPRSARVCGAPPPFGGRPRARRLHSFGAISPSLLERAQ